MFGGTGACVVGVALGAVLAQAMASPHPAHAQAPALRVQKVELRASGARPGDVARAALCGVVHEQGAPGSFEAALAAGDVELEVADAARFAIGGRVRACRQSPGHHALRCRSDERNLRAIVTRVGPGRVRICAFLRGREGETAAARPQAPIVVTLRQRGGDDRSDAVADCLPSEPQGLVCRKQPPNIVVIVTDDQRWDTLQYMPRTLELLAQRGVTFTNAFVSSPVCAPSRASLLTGLYAHHHRVRTNVSPDGGAPRFVGADASTLATWLHDEGYRTGIYGKYLNIYGAQCPPYTASCYIPPGWDDWHVFLQDAYYDYQLAENGVLTQFGNAAADYSTDVLAAKAVRFIRTARGRPFFVYLGLQAPHQEGTGLPIPAPRHEGLFDGVVPSHPISYDEADITDKPPWMGLLPRADEQIRDTILTYGVWADLVQQFGWEALQAADEAVAALVAALEAIGEAENTVIVFTSDNGYFNGEHRIYAGKNYPYEEALRVPLIIRFPPLISAAHSESSMVVNVDLAPTLAELAGVTPASPVDGRSVVPLLNGGATSRRADVFLQWWNPDREPVVPSYLGVRGERFKYVAYPEAGVEELYDLVADPFELTNRAADPDAADALAAMRARLDEYIAAQ